MTTTEVLLKAGTQISFGVSGSFNPDDDGTNFVEGLTTIGNALTMASLANGAGRQSIKVDLGATRAARYAVLAAVDFTGETPTAGLTVDFYWAPSTNATGANGNIAGNSGADAACPDGALGSITLAEFILQCQFIGQLKVHDGACVQNGFVGTFCPKTRWGQMVIVNSSGDAFENDDVENHVVMNPIVDEIQA